jgi:hypothetical protein
VVVADGERFFSPVDGSLQPWLEQLAAWPRRVALTPRPRPQWGAPEAELGRQLPLLPASAEGLLALGPLLLEGSTRTTNPTTLATAADQAQPQEPALLRGGAARWLERTPPPPATDPVPMRLPWKRRSTVKPRPGATSTKRITSVAKYWDPGMGFPCGHVVGLPSTRSIAISTSDDMTCSQRPAS